MQAIELKQIVKRAVGGEWEQFAQKHPHLAAAIDQELLVERTLGVLHASDEFLEALRQVDSGMAEANVLEELIGRVARVILIAL